MIEFIKKIIKTVKVIKDNLPELRAEFEDLQGVTKEVVGQIIEIW